ncbi:MAG TPA: hypothetical protein VL918_05065 [Sphingobium sp.]|nr:hypothetical protein [Sphingobium sp.]
MAYLNHTAALTAAFSALVLSVPAHAEDYVQFGMGVDYSNGDYGNAQDTEIFAVPFSVKVRKGDVFVRASIPYLYIRGPGGVVPGDNGPVPGGSAGAVTSNDGIGDLGLAAGFTLPVAERTYLDLSGRVKIPTASESRNLGTGTTDFTVEGALTQQFGQFSLSARGGRRFNGSSASFPLNDVWQAGAGAYYQAGDMTFGLDYDWREASLSTASDRSELTGSLTYKLTSQLRLQGYAYTGFSDGSPDAGGGLQLLYRLGI